MKDGIDDFRVEEDKIVVTSKSGHVYFITRDFCSCKGFGYHKSCRHFDEATNQGLIQLLIEKQKPIGITLSKHARLMRQEAIRVFFKKRNIAFTEKQIEFVESKINQATTPEQIIYLLNDK